MYKLFIFRLIFLKFPLPFDDTVLNSFQPFYHICLLRVMLNTFVIIAFTLFINAFLASLEMMKDFQLQKQFIILLLDIPIVWQL